MADLHCYALKPTAFHLPFVPACCGNLSDSVLIPQTFEPELCLYPNMLLHFLWLIAIASCCSPVVGAEPEGRTEPVAERSTGIDPLMAELFFGIPGIGSFHDDIERDLWAAESMDELLGRMIHGQIQAEEADKSEATDDGAEIKLNAQQLAMQQRIRRCLTMYYRIPVDTASWRPWTIMHGLLPFGKDSLVTRDGKFYNAVDYLCHNAIGNDTRMMYLNATGFGVSVGPGVQGHEGQLLAMLAQADVPREQEIRIQGRTFTIDDLIKYEQQGCRQNTELTFKLIGLSHYLDSDSIWKNSLGQSWNIERLIYEELKQPINGAACGGTHRLMGLSYAIEQRRRREQPIDGQWQRADHYIKQYQEYAFGYQNRDGSFSTNWFETHDADPDPKKRLYTTGHIVEWLTFSLPTEKLDDPRYVRALDCLLDLMLGAPQLDLEIGPRGHALHALRLFEQRRYGRNSDPKAISPTDYAIVNKALQIQKQLKPTLDSPLGSTPTQQVGYPNSGSGFGQPRRLFRRR